MSRERVELKAQIEAVAARYPERKSAVMPALHLAQDSFGHLDRALMKEVAEILEMPPVKVYEIATFYTMFRTEPTGHFHLQLCDNVTCMLLGAEKLLAQMEQVLGIKKGETTTDGLFTLSTVECLGSCGTAPVMQINDEYWENLSTQRIDEILESLRRQGPLAASGEPVDV